MIKMNLFTARRLCKFIEDFRRRTGQLPTEADLEKGGFPKLLVENAVRSGRIHLLYVTMTNGSIVKGYKVVG